MAHTLFEQGHTFSSAENSAGEINDIFVQQFGYTQNGDYYFSPIDTNFGVRWYFDGSYLYCYMTFDGGTAETEFAKIKNLELSKINYHVSMGEKTIYLRIYYASQASYWRNIGIVIAHDSGKNTVCYRGECITGSASSSNNRLYMLNIDQKVYNYDYVNDRKYKVREYLKNAIYRHPSLGNNCLFDELYGVVNVQVFASLSDTFINFDGQIYRIVSCMDNYYSDYTNGVPYFAFPVSD